MSKKYKYGPTAEAKELPRWTMIDGKPVGIGGPCEVKPDVTVKEATESQYKVLHERGNPLVEKEEQKPKKKAEEKDD